MKQTAMLKITIFVFAIVALFLGGCVDVNQPVLKPTDFRSTVRFVDLANLTSSMSVTYDKPPVTAATATYLNASAYIDMPAGTRFWTFAYGSTQDTMRQALVPNYQYSFFSVYEPSNGDVERTYILMAERNTYSGTVAYPSGSQVVRFLNLSTDSAATVSGGLTFHLMYGSTDTTTDALTFGTGAIFTAPASPAPQYMVVGAAGDTLVTSRAVGSAAGRYTVVFVGSQAASSWQTKVFTEN